MKKIIYIFFFAVLFSPIASFAVNVDEIDVLTNQINNAAEQTSSTLTKARQLIKVATTTAGIAVDAYSKTEKAVSSTVEVVRRGSAVYENLKPIVQQVGNIWNLITNNNEFWRVALVVGLIFAIWVTIRFIL